MLRISLDSRQASQFIFMVRAYLFQPGYVSFSVSFFKNFKKEYFTQLVGG